MTKYNIVYYKMTWGECLCSFIICLADGIIILMAIIIGTGRKDHPVHPVLSLRRAMETVHSARLRLRGKNPDAVPAVCTNVLAKGKRRLKETNKQGLPEGSPCDSLID